MARIPALQKLSLAQLIELQQRVDVAIGQRKAEEARDVKEKMQVLAEKSGFSLNELFGTKRGGKRGPAPIKCRNPKDPSQTWSGRGRKPNWLVAALKKGAKLDSFAVQR
jgi:DNA-binding protein H-NS